MVPRTPHASGGFDNGTPAAGEAEQGAAAGEAAGEAAGAQELLTALLRHACREVLPPAMHGILSGAKDCVRPAASSRAAGDYECRVAVSAFARLRATCHPGSSATAQRASGTVEYTTTSELGLERRWRFGSARALADALLERLPAESRALLASARADEGTGKLLFCTRAHLLHLRAQGLLHCADCGAFFAGERGLRDHQLVRHARPYEAAMEAVHVSRTQLVPFCAPPRRCAPGRAAADGGPGAQGTDRSSAASVATRRNEALERRAAAARAAPELDEGLRLARDGDVHALAALIATTGWDPRTVTDRHGSSALLWAAGGGWLDVCAFLVDECGVDPGTRQRGDGRGALHWAARNGRLAVCQWLVCEKGVRVDAPTRDGTVPLHWAVWQRHWDVVIWLVESAGANLHAANAYGCNSIQWAAQAGDVRMCAWLRARGLEVGCLNANGHSALHKAAIKGHAGVCAWLVRTAGLGLAHMQPDPGGHTPARMARCDGHAELAAWLEREEGRLRSEAGEEAGCVAAQAGDRSV